MLPQLLRSLPTWLESMPPLLLSQNVGITTRPVTRLRMLSRLPLLSIGHVRIRLYPTVDHDLTDSIHDTLHSSVDKLYQGCLPLGFI